MATPDREQILDQIFTELEKIDGTGSYKTTLATTVARELVSWEDIGASQMPWLGYAPVGESRPSYNPNGRLNVMLPVTVVGHVNVASGSAKTASLGNLEDDVIAALHSTVGVGGKSIKAHWLGTQTDEGDFCSDDSRGGSGTLVMRWEVHYKRTTTHS